MLWNVLWVSWVNFRRDRVAQLLTFVLPIVFFSISALISAGFGNSSTSKVRVAVLDEDRSEASQRLVAALRKEDGLNVRDVPPAAPGQAVRRSDALARVKDAKDPVALVIPKGFGEHFLAFTGESLEVELLADTSDPIAHQMVAGLLQRAAMTAAPDLMVERGLKLFEQFGGPFTELQRQAANAVRTLARGDDAATTQSAAAREATRAATGGFSNPVPFRVVDVLGERDRSPAIAYLAAGTAVMFLLFSASGAGGALLEEQESGTLQRLLATSLSMPTLLLGKWLFVAALGFVQVTIMFVWGSAVFGLKLWTPTHLIGFATMTVATAAAASALGLIFATACRSRAQLSGLSTLLILSMSAVGGSMVPRYIMSDTMRSLGYFTFNAWALDGYRDVFWYQKSPLQLWPYLLVLTVATVVFLALARGFARRWEIA